MAERVAAATDPLNLMRVMPPKEGPSRTGPNPDWRFSAMRFSAHGFFVCDCNNPTKSGNQETRNDF
jgi:hypothetical protein